jgi:hypothetical protein
MSDFEKKIEVIGIINLIIYIFSYNLFFLTITHNIQGYKTLPQTRVYMQGYQQSSQF